MTEDERTVHGGWYADPVATFGDRVAAAREALGLEQKALANQLGVALKTLRAWEEDRAEPRANKLQMLAGILNVSLRWLMTGQGEDVTPPDEQRAIDPEVAKVLSELRELRGEMARSADRLTRLEARLRAALAEVA